MFPPTNSHEPDTAITEDQIQRRFYYRLMIKTILKRTRYTVTLVIYCKLFIHTCNFMQLWLTTEQKDK